MVAVGYDYDIVSKKHYFKVRNSWGATGWGDQGYIKIAYNPDAVNDIGICGVLSDSYTVTVIK